MRFRFNGSNRKLCTIVCVVTMAMSVVASAVFLDENMIRSASADDAENQSVPTLEHKVVVPWKTKWQPITSFNAVFQNEKGEPTHLEKGGTYWGYEPSILPMTSQREGDLYPVVMKSEYNDVHGTVESQNLSVAMYIKYVLAESNGGPVLYLENLKEVFRSLAIGRFGGDVRNPDGRYSLFVWNPQQLKILSRLSCYDFSRANQKQPFTPVIRFDDYPADDDPHDPTGTTNVFGLACQHLEMVRLLRRTVDHFTTRSLLVKKMADLFMQVAAR